MFVFVQFTMICLTHSAQFSQLRSTKFNLPVPTMLLNEFNNMHEYSILFLFIKRHTCLFTHTFETIQEFSVPLEIMQHFTGVIKEQFERTFAVH